MAGARLFTEINTAAKIKADEHSGALPPRVEEYVYSQRDQAANIPASNVVRIGPGMYRVMSTRNNDFNYVDLNALKSGDRNGSCDCGFLAHCRSAFCLHQAAVCSKESWRRRLVARAQVHCRLAETAQLCTSSPSPDGS